MQQHGHVQMLRDLWPDWVTLPCNMVTCKCFTNSDLTGWGCHATTWSHANASWPLTRLGMVAMQQHGHVEMLHEVWPDWVRFPCNNMVTCKCFMNSDLIRWGSMQQHGHVQMLHELWTDWVWLPCNNMVTCKCFVTSDPIGYGCHATWSRANASWSLTWLGEVAM